MKLDQEALECKRKFWIERFKFLVDAKEKAFENIQDHLKFGMKQGLLTFEKHHIDSFGCLVPDQCLVPVGKP